MPPRLGALTEGEALPGIPPGERRIPPAAAALRGVVGYDARLPEGRTVLSDPPRRLEPTSPPVLEDLEGRLTCRSGLRAGLAVLGLLAGSVDALVP